MRKHLFSIGEVSKIKDITVKALRFYEKIGLIKPYFTDPDTKYRYYHVSQFIYIDIIKAARSMDISPAALVPYFTNNNSMGLYQLINKHKNLLYSKIRDLEKAIDSINEITNTMSTAQKVDKSGCIYKRNLPERHTITLPFKIDKTYNDIMIDFSLLAVLVSRRGLINCFEEGFIYSQTNVSMMPECTFTCVSEKANEFTDYRHIPGGEYVCTVLTKNNAQLQAEMLLAYLSQNKLNPQFFVQTELLMDLFAAESDYFELQAKI